MSEPHLDDIERLAALAEPVRRRLYEFVVSASPGEVGRDQAAERVGVKRGLAAFHLDKLVSAGLLTFRYQRLHERTGPGAGRPSKLYRKGPVRIDVSLPPRRYALAALLLLRALDGAVEEAALARPARAYGVELGRAARTAAATAPGGHGVEAAVLDELERQGFEPMRDPRGVVRLRNCPFEALVADHRSTVCAMNLALIEGMVGGAMATGLRPTLSPAPGFCCVLLEGGEHAA